MLQIYKYLLLAVFTFLLNKGYAQKAAIFKGRLMSLNGNTDIVQNVSVRLVNQGRGTTGKDGIFTIPISDSLREVTIELVDSKYNIIYPLGGRALIQKDLNTPLEFYIGESTKDILTKAIARSNNEIKSKLTQLGLKQDGIEAILNEFRSDIQTMTSIKVEDLRNEIEVENKKKEFYPKLSSSIMDYINEAKDLKDAFKFVAKHAFEDPQALQLLTDAINSYNIVFEKLNKEHKGYEIRVQELWQSEAKASEVRELFNYALGELHSANIFTLNLKLRDINEYFRGNIKGSNKKAAKEIIIREIESAELQLDRRLDELDNRTQVVLSDLSH